LPNPTARNYFMLHRSSRLLFHFRGRWSPKRWTFRLSYRVIVLFLATVLLIGAWHIVVGRSSVAQVGPAASQATATAAEREALAKAEHLWQQAAQLNQQGRYAEAIPLAQQALEIEERILGAHHPDVATVLNNLALLYQKQGNYTQAEPLFQRALSIYEAALGANHPLVATALNNLAELYQGQGKYAQAEPLFQHALSIAEAALGANHSLVAATLNNLAALYQGQGNYTKAEPLLQRARAIRERILGANHPDVAQSLNNLAELYRAQGKYAQAEPLYRRALSIYEAALGANHPDVAQSLNNLAALYQDQGKYAQAEPLYRRSLSIREAALGANHPDVAQSLNNLALLLYRDQGNYTQAEPLLQRVLSIYEAALGANHPFVANSLNNLAGLYQAQGNYTKAEPLFERALSIDEAVLGANHPLVATALNNLAGLYRDQGNYTQAEPLLQRARSIYEAALGANHPFVAQILNNLAELYQAQGKYAQAEQLHQRALSIREATLGANHPLVATSLNNLASLYQAQGNLTEALASLRRSMDVQETNLDVIFSSGSEARKRAYMTTLQGTTDAAISLHLQAAKNSPEAAELALTTLLRRKGRVLDAVTEGFQRLRQHLTPPDQTLFSQLQATHSQLAALSYGGLGNRSPQQYREQVSTLQTQAEQLENQLAQHSAEFRTQTQPVTLQAIQPLIPADTALVELVQYQPFNPKSGLSQRWGAPRYAAYVQQQQGTPQALDLGEAAAIDAKIEAVRQGLRSPNHPVQPAARQLDQLVMQPIRSLLGSKTHLLISPDGQLNLIPFAALVDEHNRYLLDTYTFTYLTSGRDLLKLQLKASSREAPVLFANPDYNDPGSTQVAALPGTRSAPVSAQNRGSDQPRSTEMANLRVDALPGTQREAKAIAPLLPHATVLTGPQASETAVKQLHAPSILHLATHGFFLEDVEFVPPNTRGGDGTITPVFTGPPPAAKQSHQSNENPLLRSGLALAGFNPRQGGGQEDGVLTALEVTNLDLEGTQLVVMSACETGLGDVLNGEGVYGLRRAFVMAGAESQLMSLWKVDDQGTSELMSRYYQHLQQGEDRSTALRRVQQELLQAPDYRHPYHWSAFIFSGDWSPMHLANPTRS
jgi:CHAT domain-containing protein/Tfp pilus assembly protein PilF